MGCVGGAEGDFKALPFAFGVKKELHGFGHTHVNVVNCCLENSAKT